MRALESGLEGAIEEAESVSASKIEDLEEQLVAARDGLSGGDDQVP